MALLMRRRIVKVGLEKIKGTPAVTSIPGVVYDPDIQATDNMIVREPSGSSGGRARSERGPSIGTCKLKVELRSDGVSGLDPFVLTLLNACGLIGGSTHIDATGVAYADPAKTLTKAGAFADYTFVAGDTVHIASGAHVTAGWYTVASKTSDDVIVLSAAPTGAQGGEVDFVIDWIRPAAYVLNPTTLISLQRCITVDVYLDGRHFQVYGAVGNPTLSGEFGKQVFLECDFTGLFSVEADTTLPTVSQSSAVPMLAKSAVLSLGSYTPAISKFSIKANNPIEAREDITAAEGIAYYMIGAARNYQLDMDPEATPAATWDAMGLWSAKTESAFSLMLSDGVVDVTIVAPKVQLMPPQSAARESKMVFNLVGQMNVNAGDDELTITATAHSA